MNPQERKRESHRVSLPGCKLLHEPWGRAKVRLSETAQTISADITQSGGRKIRLRDGREIEVMM